MIKKIVYSLNLFLRLIFIYLENPLSLFGYLSGRTVLLKLRQGISFYTAQLLDAVIVSETVLDDSYGVGLLDRKIKGRIIDVGAGIGDFSVLVSYQCPGADILAFEPNPSQLKLLKENIRINKRKNIRVLNLAVGNKKKYELNIPASNVHASTLSTDKKGRKIQVIGTPLSKYIRGRVDFLKIDCEGAETGVLESIKPKQFGVIKKIVCEYHNHIVPGSDKKVSTILAKYGYTIGYIKNDIVPTTGYVVASR